MLSSPFKEVKPFKFKDLHKKFGRLVWQEPSDSDLAEGNIYVCQLWFIETNGNMYLLHETRIPDQEKP